MNRHALQVLQFPETLDVVAGFAAGPMGAAAVRALEPSIATEWVDNELRRVEEMLLFTQRIDNAFVTSEHVRRQFYDYIMESAAVGEYEAD